MASVDFGEPSRAAAGRSQRAAVLCPGPSLQAALECDLSGQFGRVLGVNRAASAWPCDYWCFLDAETYDDRPPLGKPVIVTSKVQWSKLLRRRPEAAKRHGVLFRSGLRKPPAGFRLSSFSALLAAWAAYSLGAKEIVVFGSDLCGAADWDGVTLPRQRRGARRWRRERAAWDRLDELLRTKGVRLKR